MTGAVPGTRVLLADDQTMIRAALATMVDLESDLVVVGQVGNCAEVVAAAAELHPDVVLMDVQMPTGDGGPADGLAATAAVLAASPTTRVIVLTTFGRPGYLRRAMEAGAVGFMVKDSPADTLIEGIRRVAAGLRAVDPELAAASLSAGPNPLSAREIEVLTATAAGGSTAAIAARVHLSEGTVRNHLSAIFAKLGAGSRAEAVAVATEQGWLG
ncbi:response regulator transcription factor [Parenemella sanctibonifatiensis]|uniref:DNA-binding response regulator n=1 Tax=Parenemella sanctibonifatiensis TaxID=2016505 RepID=A0A255EVB8_9ACTN|nr:response regulator transcription factor [Parenemella sanctibonifatiensis]OYN92093.1 DNA-binding response regulator [Parenemella sanctibonifatiensis]